MKKIFKIIVIVITIWISLSLFWLLFNFIYISFSIKMEDPVKIEKIIKEAKSKKDVNICNKIKGAIKNNKWFCINEVAIELKDESLCEKISEIGTDWKEGCYFNVAKEKQDYSLCEKSGTWENYCYKTIEKKTGIKPKNKIKKDVNKCYEFESSNGQRENCFIEVALFNEDASICEKIEIEQGMLTKNFCYSRVASELNDLKLCEKTGEYRDICIENIKQGKDSKFIIE